MKDASITILLMTVAILIGFLLARQAANLIESYKLVPIAAGNIQSANPQAGKAQGTI